MSRDAEPSRGHVNELGGATPALMPVPRQLPGVRRVVNRSDTLAALARRDGVTVVSGPAGIGKTAMALHWAHSSLEHFPDGQLYADLQGHSVADPALPTEVLGRFIRALGVPDAHLPVTLAERAALYRSLAAGRRMLVFLDDAFSAAQVSPLLPGGGENVALVTSRWRLPGLVMQGARAITLGPLAEDAALELLRNTLGIERVSLEEEAASQLVEQCARSPLALAIAAARLATRPHWTLAEMVRALAQERRRLTVLSAEDDMTIRAALALSYRNLPGSVQHLFRMLGVYPGATFDDRMAAALADVPVHRARERIGVLIDANLLDDLPGDRYQLNELARLYAQELAEEAEPEATRRAALRRLVEVNVMAALNASRVIAPYRRLADPGFQTPDLPDFNDPGEALDWLDQEFGNFRAIARRALADGLHRQTWLLVDAAWPLFLHRGHSTERLEFDRTGLAAARADGDPVAEAKMLNRTGLALRELGELGEAAQDFTAALQLWRQLGDRTRIAGTRRRLGLLELDRDRPDAAATHFADALDAYRALGEDRRVALTLSDLGATLIKAGRVAEAAEALAESGRLLAATPDRYNQARALLLLGQAYARGPQPAQAVPHVERGLAIMREIGSALGEGDALHVLGDLAVQEGRMADARRLLTEARQILADAGAPTRILDDRLAELDR